jgi:hypothetical protein
MTLASSVNEAPSAIDDARVVIYESNMFIIQATGLHDAQNNDTQHNDIQHNDVQHIDAQHKGLVYDPRGK